MKHTLLSLVTVLVLASSLNALPTTPSGICPPGFNETFNVNTPGCTFCAAPVDCAVGCVGPPGCFCAPGDLECCANVSPCCQNCPDPKPLHCSTIGCQCTPSTCCSTICPASAPTSSGAGLGMLAAVLGALGYGVVQGKLRRR